MAGRVRKCAYLGLLSILFLSLFIGGTAPPNQANSAASPSYFPPFGDEAYLRSQDYLTNGKIRIFLNYNETATLSELVSCVSAQQGVIRMISPDLHLISAELPYHALSRLQSWGPVHLDRKIQACLEQSVPLIKPAWSQIESFFGTSVNGSTIKVAVLDSGITVTHPDLDDLDDNAGTTDLKVINQYNFITNSSYAPDDNGHGTHVAGIFE